MATSAPTDVYATIKAHTQKIRASQQAVNDLTRGFYEAKIAGLVKGGKWTTTTEQGEEKSVTLSDINRLNSAVYKEIENIPSMIRDIERAKKAAKRARNSANGLDKPRNQPPTRYRSELIDFFKHANLGPGTDGSKTLQEQKIMANFFTNAVGNLTFGVSLLNVWGYMNKLTNNDSKVVTLDANARKYLGEALARLQTNKTAALEKAMASGDAKHIKVAKDDLDKFQLGQIQNKDYMTILTTYRKEEPEMAEQLKAFEPVVAEMSKITKDLNAGFKARAKATLVKDKAAAKTMVPHTPLKRSASPAPSKPAVPPVMAPPAMAIPPVMSIPAATATKEKKARK